VCVARLKLSALPVVHLRSASLPCRPVCRRCSRERPAGRGGRGAHREGWSGRGREYDRISGTGFGKEVAKEGAGAHNWGSIKDDVKAGAEGAAAAEATEGEKPAAEGAEGAAAAAPEAPVEEVDNTITLADAEKARSAKREGTLFATAKEDTSALMSQFSGVKKVGAEEEDDEFAFFAGSKHAKKAAAEEEEEEAAEEAEEDLAKGLLQFRIAGPNERPRSERPEGGRGRGRGAPRGAGGRGGRGGFRGPREGGEGAPAAEGAPAGGERRGRGRGAPRGAPRGGAGGRGGAPRASHAVSAADFPALGK